MSAKASSSAPAIVEDIENETYLDEEEGIEEQEEEDEFNEDDLCENDDNIDYDEWLWCKILMFWILKLFVNVTLWFCILDFLNLIAYFYLKF